jgi:transcriptional regulator GlxA family with amidase domain
VAQPRTVAALAYPGVQLLDIVGPLEAFNLASQQRIDDSEASEPAYRVVIVGKERGSIASMSGLTITAERDLSDPVDDIDTLMIPGALSGGAAFYDDPDYITWVQKAAPVVPRMCSVCSGALLLASAGILDGRRATTHWMDAEELRNNYPAVRVEANRIYLEDDGVFTSGGITAGIDLALALIERDHSRRLALKTAKRLLVFLKRPGDQLQFSSFLESQAQPSQFEALLDWLTENLDQNFDSAALAKRACMSERSFRRKFEVELGMTPRRYVARARLNKARSLLETTDSSLAVIARRCGYRTSDAMRYAFTRELDVTPTEYRQRFG